MENSNDRWKRENTVFYGVRLQKKTDADVIEWLEKHESKAGAIKKAVRYAIHAETDKEEP